MTRLALGAIHPDRIRQNSEEKMTPKKLSDIEVIRAALRVSRSHPRGNAVYSLMQFVAVRNSTGLNEIRPAYFQRGEMDKLRRIVGLIETGDTSPI